MESLRPLLTTYAYNILGSWDEAKDVVQDAFLKFMQMDGEGIEDKKAYLVRTVINLSINQKKRQKKLIATYPGEWLPEPVATEKADSVIIGKEVLSYSLMVLLEKLNARQRAVFILKEAFDYEHEEIAEVLGLTVENSRKILSRAKSQLRISSGHLLPDRDGQTTDYLDKYLNVIRSGDTARLEQLLAADIMVTSDGGGKATAFRNTVHGKKDVGALLLGVFRKFYHAVRIDKGWVNHQPALFYYDGDKLVTCQVFSVVNGQVDHIFFIRNPDKLSSLSI
jgi:RNA polymerase sigma factor (sigma-70 family)